jgi:diguanylate cyclase (GGDEF)-like protein
MVSIKYKIFLPAFFILLLSVSVISYYFIQYTKENIKKLSIEQLHSIGHITQERINQFLRQTEDQVNIFNSRVLLKKTLQEYINTPDKELVYTLNGILKSSHTNNGSTKDIILFDTKGKIITSKSNTINENNFFLGMFDKSKNGTYSHISFIDGLEKPILCIGSPIFNENQFLGVAVFKIQITYLKEILEQRTGLGRSGEALLGIYDKNKNIILISNLRFSKSPLIIKSDEIYKAIPMRLALENKADKIVENQYDYRDVPVVSSVYYYEPLDIGIVVKKDIKEIMEPVNELIQELLIISIIVFIISLIMSFIISRYVTIIINKIVKITSSISEGDIHKRIEYITNDELGALSTSINNMSDSLVNMNKTLEDKVKEKTYQLEISNNKLENIFNTTPNITLITDGRTLLKANNQFYTFTGYESLEDFAKDHNCICDMFIVRSGYLRSKINGLSWIEHVILNQHETHKAIIEKDKEEYLFLVNAAQYNENSKTYFIVVLENITKLQKAAYTDQLTKLVNRIKIDEMLEICAGSFERYKNIYSIILLDIDNFKLVNDTYGHLLGDNVLKHIAIILKRNTRNIDLVGRWGGEEFLIISKETDLNGASELAEKIRRSVESSKFEKVNHLTVSIGVAQIKENETIDELLKRVDDALYEAKEAGRNKVVVSK